MCPFDYDVNEQEPSNGGGGSATPGVYQYKVDDVQEVTFKTGSQGWKVILLVGALPNKDIQVYENLVQSPKVLWKFRKFCDSVGVDFAAKPQGGWRPEHFLNKSGKAAFKKKDDGFLGVDEFLPAGANNGPDSRPVSAEKGDDCPF